MSQRHPIQNNRTQLITTVTKDRTPLFENDAYAREAIECLYRVQERYPFFLYAFVIMPDHCHFLVMVQEPQKLSNIMSRYKSGLSHAIGIGPIWQQRFHVRGVDNAEEAKRYIHENPMKAGLCESPDAYPWSSASSKWDITPMQAWHFM